MSTKFEKKKSVGSPEWMNTYADIVTLLLCFFVFLFAFSNIDSAKYKELQQSFNPNSTANGNIEITQQVSDEIAYQNELKELQGNLQSYIDNNSLSNEIAIENANGKITIHFNSSMFFDSGDAVIKENAKIYIQQIAKTFPKKFNIQIEGHTDNLPISNSKFASNWELSALRGVNVLKFLIETCNIEPSRMSAAGYGEYRPIKPNDSDVNRQANRRVDVILFKAQRTQS